MESIIAHCESSAAAAQIAIGALKAAESLENEALRTDSTASKTAAATLNESRPVEPGGADLEDWLSASATEVEQVDSGEVLEEGVVDYNEADDELLVAKARLGDGSAFEELSNRYRFRMRQKVYGIVRNWDDADDVVQETFFKAYICLHQFRGSSRFSTWLFRIAVNRALMLLRKRGSTREVSYDVGHTGNQPEAPTWDFPDPSPNPEQQYEHRQKRERLQHAVSRLPRTLSDALGKYHYEDRSLNQVAEELGISLAAAKSRLLRARLALRTSVKKRLRLPANSCRTHRNGARVSEARG